MAAFQSLRVQPPRPRRGRESATVAAPWRVLAVLIGKAEKHRNEHGIDYRMMPAFATACAGDKYMSGDIIACVIILNTYRSPVIEVSAVPAFSKPPLHRQH